MPSPLYSTSAVAHILGLHPERVRRLAQSRGLGKRAIGSTGAWLFTETDIDAMRIRKPGRPRKLPTN